MCRSAAPQTGYACDRLLGVSYLPAENAARIEPCLDERFAAVEGFAEVVPWLWSSKGAALLAVELIVVAVEGPVVHTDQSLSTAETVGEHTDSAEVARPRKMILAAVVLQMAALLGLPVASQVLGRICSVEEHLTAVHCTVKDHELWVGA